jgi:hypothetical protein
MELAYQPYEIKIVNGSSLTYGNMILFDGYNISYVWKFICGGWGYGSIPHGIYELNNPRIFPDTEEFKAYKHHGYPWGIDLKPLFKTTRTGLMLHADGNLPGTLGCESPDRDVNDIKVFEILKPLIVSGQLKYHKVL